MRLAGLGVLALVLIGILIYLGQSGAFSGVTDSSGRGDIARFDDDNQTVMTSLDVEGTSVFAAPAAQDAPLILSGLPDYASMEFRLPVDARPVSGDLDLAFTSLVTDDAEGVLRVSINGVKRADYLLNQGEQTDTLQVQLTPAELASGVVSVGLSLQGRGAIAECTTDDAIAAVVNINGSSGLRLNLSEEPSSARDRLALWGDRVPVSWTNGLSDDEAASLVHGTAVLFGKGYQPVFAEEGTGVEALLALAGNAERRSRVTIPAGYPIALTSDPSNAGLRKFTRRSNWRYSYNVGDLPDGRLPSALDLRMQVGPATTSLERDIAVTMNNRLLFSRRIGSDVERLNQSIAIPAGLQSSTNALDITISAYDADDLRCGDIAQSVAELLPETVLRIGEKAAPGELDILRAALTRTGSVALSASNLSGPDAAAAAYLLSDLAPDSWEVSANANRASVQVISNGDAALAAQPSQMRSNWIVFLGSGTGDRIIAQRLDQASLSDIPGVALLVSITGAPSRSTSTGGAQ